MEWSPEVLQPQPAPHYKPMGNVFAEVKNAGGAQQRPAAAGDKSKRGSHQAAPRPSALAQCERHRKAGNAAFQHKKYGVAEAEYSAALGVLARDRASGTPDLVAPLYSNRAAARLMLGKPVSAGQDCRHALEAQPDFVRASLRLATCLLRLGQFADAAAAIRPLLARKGLEPGRRRDVEAKLAEVAGVEARASAGVEVLLAQRAGPVTVPRLTEALGELDAALREAPSCSALRAWRAEALLRLGRLEEAAAGAKPRGEEALPHAAWGWWVEAQVAWHNAEMETAVRLLETGLTELRRPQETDTPAGEAPGGASHFPLPGADAVAAARGDVASLLSLKNAGNAAFRQSKLAEAKAAYSKPLAPNGVAGSPAIAAVLHSNRAAVLHKEGSLLCALADCCRARALNPRYHKSYSRLAAILLDLHRPAEAVKALQAMLENTSLERKEKADAEKRIQAARQQTSERNVADHYKLLGLQRSCTTEEVRRAYKKLALKYHPDKATSSTVAPALALCASVAPAARDCELAAWERRAREEAEWVFKCVGEAHTVLVDPAKRASLDAKLDSWARGAGGAGASSRRSAHAGTSSYAGRPGHYSYQYRPSYGHYGSSSYARPGGTYGAGAGGSHRHGYAPGGPSYNYDHEEWESDDDDAFYW